MLRCPCCGHDRFRLSREPPGDSLDGAALYCGSCTAPANPLRPPGAPAPAFRAAGAGPQDQEAPPSTWWWLGFVYLDSGEFFPVALAPTLGRCWAVLLDWPGRPDMLCVPTRPPEGREQ
jgi:hypothetical protein